MSVECLFSISPWLIQREEDEEGIQRSVECVFSMPPLP
jgi:hypothetical protein